MSLTYTTDLENFPDKIKIFTLLFSTLGPLKMLGPFLKMTQGADNILLRKISTRAIFISCAALLVAALLGEFLLEEYGIPLPILAITAGIIMFLVALQGILQQFTPQYNNQYDPPTLSIATSPLAIPTIVTPYGIAAVIIFLVLSPSLIDRLIIGGMLLGIMTLNYVMMILSSKIQHFKVAILILGSILGIIQAALGLQIIYNSVKLI